MRLRSAALHAHSSFSAASAQLDSLPFVLWRLQVQTEWGFENIVYSILWHVLYGSGCAWLFLARLSGFYGCRGFVLW